MGLGTWRSEPGQVGAAVLAALTMGYRQIDCASVYGNGAGIGSALSSSLTVGLVQREDLWITSKLWNDCHAPKHVKPALQRTLADLQLDPLDLYLIHWPVAHRHGVMMPRAGVDQISLERQPLADAWGAMEALVQEELVKAIGASNVNPARLSALASGASSLACGACRWSGIHGCSSLSSFSNAATWRWSSRPTPLWAQGVKQMARACWMIT